MGQQFGVKIDEVDNTYPGSILYGVTPDDKLIPVQVDSNGVLSSSLTLIGDITVASPFVITDPNTTLKANVILDGINNALVVTANVLALPTGAATEATLIAATAAAAAAAESAADLATRPTSSSVANVAASASSITILALNTNRRGATFFNDSSSVLFVKLGATASAASFSVKLQPGSYYEMTSNYSGRVDGVWVSAVGSVLVTELFS